MFISDILSISVGLVYIIPSILYVFTQNNIHLKALLGTIGTTLISEIIKFNLIGKQSPRPSGAKNCNMLCNDGNQQGQPGMPSSHSASVAFFSGFYIQQTSNPIIQISLLIYAGAVMISRWIKRCHSFSQIIVGGILGMSLSFIVVRHL